MIEHAHKCGFCACFFKCTERGGKHGCIVSKAARVNKCGPYCERCRNGIMFVRYCALKGDNPASFLRAIMERESGKSHAAIET